MKGAEKRRGPGIVVSRILQVILVLLVLFIIGVTVGVFVARHNAKDRVSAPVAVQTTTAPASQAGGQGQRVFTGLGKLRETLANNSGVVIVRIDFPYNAGDRAFTEELARNVSVFRDKAGAYFSKIKAGDPVLKDEAIMKKALLTRFNEGLVLGKITELYFYDFLVI
jgi:flagellar basal body-associated protein FliL